MPEGVEHTLLESDLGGFSRVRRRDVDGFVIPRESGAEKWL